MTNWEHLLSNIIERYEPADIYNVDETGIFLKLVPDKTMEFKNVQCHGGKLSKDRLTVLVCANMDGSDKLPLLVIGKSAKPRCFKSVKSLPTEYQSNKKAWMTGDMFTEWLNKLNKQMQQKRRKIAMIVDNCPAHPKLKNLKAIELVFLPPNTTSQTQPMDQGIINNLKCHYKRLVIMKQLAAADDNTEVQITVLDALYMMQQSWTKLTKATIENCFRHAVCYEFSGKCR
ncbi:tigger transposable element-derived protein 4-like [Gigantopelta aegis]|uniref:tigger transposable element-derived protein 4-like n=1 Tax=Gigantopelta aegis TaxID=1735272 RepID=UPI001B88C477|nr:tigger transposable element-derived protein 4-like [Gigantopelta aegis]